MLHFTQASKKASQAAEFFLVFDKNVSSPNKNTVVKGAMSSSRVASNKSYNGMGSYNS